MDIKIFIQSLEANYVEASTMETGKDFMISNWIVSYELYSGTNNILRGKIIMPPFETINIKEIHKAIQEHINTSFRND